MNAKTRRRQGAGPERAETVLLYPPLSPGVRPRYAQPPLGVVSLASYLAAHGCTARVVDAEKSGLDLEETIDAVVDGNPGYVGISVLTEAFASVRQIAEGIRGRGCGVPIVLGGPHVTAVRGEALEDIPAADYLVLGEGERALLELIRRLKGRAPLEGVPGLVHRDGRSRPVAAVPAPGVRELDALPIADFDLVDGYRPGDYRALYARSGGVGAIIAARGCPYRCSFCAAHLVHGHARRSRSPAGVADEMSLWREKRGVRFIVFKDGTFTLDRDWTLGLCEEILSRGISLEWSCNARVDTVDRVLLETMKRAGLRVISYGVESGSDPLLKSLGKGFALADVRRGFELTRRAGVKATASFMLGVPGETPETVRQTVALARELEPHLVKFSIATCFPGTRLYEDAVRSGVLADPRWYLRDCAPGGGASALRGAPRIEGLDLEQALEDSYRAVFLSGGYLSRKLVEALRSPHLFLHAARNLGRLASLARGRRARARGPCAGLEDRSAGE